jgi:PAS domain S-box-containing protein
MTEQKKTKEELAIKLQELQQKYDSLKEISGKYYTERDQAEEELKEYRVHLEELVKERKGELEDTIKELQQSEENFHSLFSKMAEGVYLHEIIYNQKGEAVNYRIIETNTTSEKMLNIKSEDAVGKLATELYGTEEAPYLDIYAKVAKTGTPFNFEEYFHPLKKHFHISVYSPEKGKFATIFSDITERKQLEEVKKKQKEILQRVFDNIPVMITYFNETGKIEMVNRECVEKLGWTFKDWDSKNILTKCYPDPETYKEALDFMVNKPVGWKDFKTTTKCGTVIITTWTNISLSNGISIGIGQDITERKLTEDALRESEESYRKLFENHSAVKIILDPDTGVILDANDAAAQYYKWTREELKHMKIYQINTLSTEEVNVEMERVRSKRRIRFEFRHRRADGSIRDVEVFSSKIEIRGKDVLHSIIHDITERNQVEEELKNKMDELTIVNKELAFQNEEKEKQTAELIIANKAILHTEKNFHRSISKSPLGIRIVSVDGETIYANKAFLSIFEIKSLEEFTSIRAINLYTPESYTQHQERKEKRKKGHDVFDYEISIVCANTEIRHIKILRREVLWNGIKHYQVINLDITEQKKLTTDLIAVKEQAEESDRLKSAFLANMSHEIRTPMNGILGFTELLKEPNLTVDEQQDFIQTIRMSGARMLNTINNIVNVSKIESGMIKVDIQETNINEKIKFSYKFFKPEVENKGLQFIFKNSLPEKEAIIKTDDEKVYGILNNLIKNAIKFTYEGSIEFGYKKRGEYLEFFVKDTGVGIPENQKELIFERFRQGRYSFNRLYEGSGLGLSICKSYVEMLGGKIWVESEEGRGSIFYFTIPYNTVSEETNVIENVVSAEIKEVQIKKLKILIVEDEKISNMLITRFVKIVGQEILNAMTGVEAVDACRNNPDLDLILMDIQMPEMDGYEATRQIRQFNKDVIIIAQTAFAFAGDREKSIEAGCNDYISKPINKDKFLALIQKQFKK